MALDTTSTLTALMQEYYDKLFLERAKPTLVMYEHGQKRSVPLGEGKVVRFTKYTSLAKVTTALTEGANPSNTNLSASTLSTTIEEWGAKAEIASFVSLTALDRNIKEKVELFGDQAGLSIDWQIMSEVASNATEQIANDATLSDVCASSVTASDVLNMTEIRLSLRSLKISKAMRYPDGYFVGVLNPNSEYDFSKDTEWVDSGKYKDNTRLYTGEIGKWFGIRFVGTTEPLRMVAGGTLSQADAGDIYSNLIMGKHAYGVVELEGQGKRIIVKTPGPHSTYDALNRFSTCGWIALFKAKMLDSSWVINIKSGVSA